MCMQVNLIRDWHKFVATSCQLNEELMKKTMENFPGPINSDLDLMWFMTNMYLEQDKKEYKDEIEQVIRKTHDFVVNKIQRKDLDPETYSIIKALVAYNMNYFKEEIDPDKINRAVIETVRNMLSTLRHTQSYS